MKQVAVIFILIIAYLHPAKAQTNLCDNIRKIYATYTNMYFTPDGDNFFNNSPNVLSFEKKYDLETGDTTMYLILGTISGDMRVIPNTVTVEFEDNDVLTFTDQTVLRDAIAFSSTWRYNATIRLSANEFAKFKTKKIHKFKIAGLTCAPLTHDFRIQTMAYANCLDSLNKKQ